MSRRQLMRTSSLNGTSNTPWLSDPKSESSPLQTAPNPNIRQKIAPMGPRPIIFILDRKGVIKAQVVRGHVQEAPPVSLVIENSRKGFLARKDKYQ